MMDFKQFANLESMSFQQLEDIYSEEIKKTTELRNKIKTEILRIGIDFKKYEIGEVKRIDNNDFRYDTKKALLLAKIRATITYNQQLLRQLNQIKTVSSKDMLGALLGSYDNIRESKQVAILRNMGYSEEEINVILKEIRGDEEYEELKEVSETIIADWYQSQREDNDDGLIEPVNPFLI